MERKFIKGIDASPGIAIGKVFLYQENELLITKESSKTIEEEKQRLILGQEKTKKQLEAIKERTLLTLGKDKADIFDGHITLLEDEDLLEEINDLLEEGEITAEFALKTQIEEYCKMLSNLEDAYLRERAADLQDIGKRWLYNVAEVAIVDLSSLPANTVIVAKDLTPSDTAQVDLENVLAFVTEIGGKTAHSSIMARSLELPAVVGTGNICSLVNNGEMIIVDALAGEIILNPTQEELESYQEKQRKFLQEKEMLKQLQHKAAISKDGVEVGVWCNIGSPKDVKGVLNNGGQGIGLYRTEFLFMNNDRFPTEEEQFEAYKEVAMALEGKPVTIRTMDIGGDKSLPYMELPKEENPFLGWRAIRVCLDRIEILETQFKALLRASAFGTIKIMLPMIMDITEIRRAKALLEKCKAELKEKGIAFDEKIPLGIMVETPAVAFRAKYFAKEVDFFSIGTNDLTQYTLAVDRGNENISHLYDSYNPAVLQAIQASIEGAHEAGIQISMCGEFAGDEKATALLFGMGLDAFSMSAISVPRIKQNILRLEKASATALVNRVMSCATSEEVMQEIKNFQESLENI
ncbi:phosphoenolpyruvate-protein phosphotransferase [Fusobacterium necrophorum subsp. funduliforme ATCC 51357]|uniref:Phosphoenolpyruvate-protein phosphotransferase n=1 Tax=Fusobacterium necrophorum subsp. funduliforme TaxID=143387 RepID=A0A162JEN1_9FUSO|nr:phosphoenolpyruvate--protein phosphotransferase [Fusobacterium necrophorum]AYV93181.1 phosphoenolpyruvate--protein phosphotransferase [Fusobacterium necrophorum subsp. funduliforme]EIJ68311.1 phosphoenolpyruvate-protein phosphotransferase [Fusobacterium necrophorum subsp. funduliforme ATCC 51357]KAB0554320.1 phosphoenolpyruvate--protein phosphotransferase [Fusobacterium necrophorum subsp. funduliforme]KYL05638.1 phosphoenolpyruvate--protein phosphotransferase [Fusobacterium necrophorum subsp